MSDYTIEQIELNKEALHIADVIRCLFKSGHITIGVNIEPEYAKAGSGQWNITKAYAKIGTEYIELDEGRVEIIDGI
jgi:adenine specific DNA methylase Mod